MKINIDEEFDGFFEFDADDRYYVTSTSCKLFAEYIMTLCENDYLLKVGKVKSMLNQSVVNQLIGVNNEI
jgi:hypothetical protein